MHYMTVVSLEKSDEPKIIHEATLRSEGQFAKVYFSVYVV